MDRKHCVGCYNNDYNYGLGGAKECWSLADATLIKRKRVHINQIPPWKQPAELLPACYTQPQYVFVGPEQER